MLVTPLTHQLLIPHFYRRLLQYVVLDEVFVSEMEYWGEYIVDRGLNPLSQEKCHKYDGIEI